MMLKLRFKISQKRSHRIFSNFAIIEAIMAGTNSLKRFLKKPPVTEKHKDKKKKRNGVIALPWRLRLQWNPDHKKFSSLNNTLAVTFSHIYTHTGVVNAQTWKYPPWKIQTSHLKLKYKFHVRWTTVNYVSLGPGPAVIGHSCWGVPASVLSVGLFVFFFLAKLIK